MKNQIKPYFFLIIGIVLLAISHMTFTSNLAGWIVYVPFLIFLKQTRGYKSRLIFALALAIGWSFVVIKIITPPIPYFLIPMYAIPISLFHLPGFIIWDRMKNSKWSMLIFPAVLTLMEWIQYSFTPLGSWGIAAYTQSDFPVIMQFLSIFGLAGLSFLIYWVNSSLADFLTNRMKMSRKYKIPLALVIAVIFYGSIRINVYNSKGRETIQVSAILTDGDVSGFPLPSDEISRKVKASLFERTRTAAESGSKLAVWTEASTFVMPDDEPSWEESLKYLASENNISLMAAYVVPVSKDPFRYENKYIFIDSRGNNKYEYHKHQPVPGEPCNKGDQVLEVHDIKNSKVGGVICYDYDFPYLAKAYGDLAADIVAIPSSDWRGIDPLHTKMAAFRAVEQGHSIIRSTRFGLSAAINPNGEMVAKMSSFDSNQKILTSSLPEKGLRTIYSIIGDLFMYLNIAFLVFILIASLIKRIVNRES